MDVRLGTLSLQANERADVFAILDIYQVGIEESDETFLDLDEPHFELSSAWLNGMVPLKKPVEVEGDSSVIRVWYKGEEYVDGAIVRVYLEYEEVEELIAVELEAEQSASDSSCSE